MRSPLQSSFASALLHPSPPGPDALPALLRLRRAVAPASPLLRSARRAADSSSAPGRAVCDRCRPRGPGARGLAPAVWTSRSVPATSPRPRGPSAALQGSRNPCRAWSLRRGAGWPCRLRFRFSRRRRRQRPANQGHNHGVEDLRICERPELLGRLLQRELFAVLFRVGLQARPQKVSQRVHALQLERPRSGIVGDFAGERVKLRNEAVAVFLDQQPGGVHVEEKNAWTVELDGDGAALRCEFHEQYLCPGAQSRQKQQRRPKAALLALAILRDLLLSELVLSLLAGDGVGLRHGRKLRCYRQWSRALERDIQADDLARTGGDCDAVDEGVTAVSRVADRDIGEEVPDLRRLRGGDHRALRRVADQEH